MKIRSCIIFFLFIFVLGKLPLAGQIDPDFHVSFQINEDYLIGQALLSKGSYCIQTDYLGQKSQASFQTEIKGLKNAAWEISPIWYNFITGNSGDDSNFLAFSNLRQSKGGLFEFLDNVKQTPQFKAILERTLARKAYCEKQWENNLAFTHKAIKDMTGIDPKGKFTIFIGYPGLQGGRNYGEKTIAWGGLESWPNYSTIYIWHEILHSIIPGPELRPTDLDHALIQLIAENELKARLNKSSYPPFEGHDSLVSIETKILPFWKDYLENPKKDILSFRQYLIEEKKVAQWADTQKRTED